MPAGQARTMLPDGLYQVTKFEVCAGFVIAGGKLTACAPVLRNKLLSFWIRYAVRIGE